jgi:hypothetical protein
MVFSRKAEQTYLLEEYFYNRSKKIPIGARHFSKLTGSNRLFIEVLIWRLFNFYLTVPFPPGNLNSLLITFDY